MQKYGDLSQGCGGPTLTDAVTSAGGAINPVRFMSNSIYEFSINEPIEIPNRSVVSSIVDMIDQMPSGAIDM